MQTVNDCLNHYCKLQAYLEEDLASIKGGFQGELMDAYKAVVKQEIFEVDKEKYALKKANGKF